MIVYRQTRENWPMETGETSTNAMPENLAVQFSPKTGQNKGNGESDEAVEPTATAQGVCSPLLCLLTSKETVPRLLECEKAILVAREHDYDRVPERCELTQITPAILQAAGSERAQQVLVECTDATPRTCESRKISRHHGTRRSTSLRNALLDSQKMLLSARQDLLKPPEDTVSAHVREMVSLQASLIRELQEQLHVQGLELCSVRKEKEQLEARLERMDRRMSVLQKHSRDKDNHYKDSSPPAPEPRTPRQSRRGPLSNLVRTDNLERQSHSRSSSVDRVRGRPSRVSHSATPNSHESSHKVGKRSVLFDEVGNSSKRTRSSRSSDQVEEEDEGDEDIVMVVDARYNNLGLQLPQTACHPRNSRYEKNTRNTNTEIKIPRWKERQVSCSMPKDSPGAATEDLSDEIFLKRHNKPEIEEKRRKRWDAQRFREKFHHDQLLKKYMQKEGNLPAQDKKKGKIQTLLPKTDEIESILLTETVVVCAFGQPLPVIKPNHFILPDLSHSTESDALRSTRSRSRHRHSANGSSFS